MREIAVSEVTICFERSTLFMGDIRLLHSHLCGRGGGCPPKCERMQTVGDGGCVSVNVHT